MRCATIFLTVLALIGLILRVEAAPRGTQYKVAVMEFGTFQDIDINDLKATDSEKSLYTMIIKQLIKSKAFTVIDQRYEKSLLDEAGINSDDELDPDIAKKLGEILDVPYIICGTVRNIAPIESECTVLTGGMKLYSVRARVSLIMLDVKTGKYVKGAIGNGTSSSSHVKVGSDIHTLNIGTTKVAQSSVTNALLKASEDAVEKLAAELSV